MESQSFVFLKLRWEVQERTTSKELFLPLVRTIADVSLIAINRILLTEPEQVGFSMTSHKINYPLHSNNPQNLLSLFQLLQVFFKSLPPPVCLVAHNGANLDFPILKSELKRVLKDCPEIGGTFDNVYWVDSADGFLKLIAPSTSLSDVDKASRRLFEDDLENVKPNASSLVVCEWNVTDFDDELAVITDIASTLYKKKFNRYKLESIVQDEYYLTKFGNRKTKKRAERKNELDAKNIKHSKEKTPLRMQMEEASRRMTVDLSLEAVYQRVFGESVTICGIEGEVEALAEMVTQLGIPIVEIFDRIKVPFLSKEFV